MLGDCRIRRAVRAAPRAYAVCVARGVRCTAVWTAPWHDAPGEFAIFELETYAIDDGALAALPCCTAARARGSAPFK